MEESLAIRVAAKLREVLKAFENNLAIDWGQCADLANEIDRTGFPDPIIGRDFDYNRGHTLKLPIIWQKTDEKAPLYKEILALRAEVETYKQWETRWARRSDRLMEENYSLHEKINKMKGLLDNGDE